MDAVLQEVNAALGVTGSFVVGGNGKVEARVLADGFATQALETVGRTLVQTLGGIELARKRKVGDLDMVFAEGRLLVKSLSPGGLCILTAKRVNVPLVNLTANVAVKKLKDLRRDAAPVVAEPAHPSPAAAAAPMPATPAAAQAPAATVDGRVFALIERDLARAIGGEAQLVLYYEVAAMGLSKSAFPRAYLGDLVERLSGEIDEPARRAQFVQAAQQAIAGG
jgi:hypothetical protein